MSDPEKITPQDTSAASEAQAAPVPRSEPPAPVAAPEAALEASLAHTNVDAPVVNEPAPVALALATAAPEATAAPVAEAPAPPVLTPVADASIAPPVPSGPYRTPPHEPTANVRVGPAPWPILGPALATYGVFTWAFVVLGQFTTSWSTGKPLGQSVAAGLVFAVSMLAWIFALRRSVVAAPAGSISLVARAIASGLVAVLFFGMSLFAAVLFGQSGPRNHDLLVAFVLVALAITARVVGGRITLPEPPERTHGAKFAVVAAWVVSLLATLVAGADLASNG